MLKVVLSVCLSVCLSVVLGSTLTRFKICKYFSHSTIKRCFLVICNLEFRGSHRTCAFKRYAGRNKKIDQYSAKLGNNVI